MTSMSPKLRNELELIHGMDDVPMIFDPVTGRYHRVSRSAEAVLQHLDGSRTTDDLVELLSGGAQTRSDVLRRELDPFLADLGRNGLLVGSDLPDKVRQTGRARSSMLMPRIVLTRSLPVLLEPIARGLRRTPLRPLAALAALVATAGYLLGGYALLASVSAGPRIVGTAFLLAVVLQLLFVAVHELAHAVVAQVLKVPVRGLGVALLFYFMPVAYVDRTDAYRLRGRGGRVALALAGITSDGWLCGITATFAIGGTGLVQHTAVILLGLQMIGLAVNVNPLLPSDGYSAIEAATGLIDARGRAFALLRSGVTRKQLPRHLAVLPLRARLSYIAYGAVCVVYTCVLGTGAVVLLVQTAIVVIEAIR